MKTLNYLLQKLDNRFLTLSFILLFAFILRIYNINFEGLWTDEMICLYTSNPGFSLRRMYDVLHFWDQTPPLYPLLLWLWFKIAGYTEFQARFFSVIGGTLSLFVIYQLIKELYNRKSALIITFLLAITPYHIYFSREARSYIWAFLSLSLVLYLFVKQLKNYDKKHTRLFFILAGGLFLHISYFSFFIHAGLVCIILYTYFIKKTSINLKNWIIDYLLVGILFLPWLLQFIRILNFHNEINGSPSFLYVLNVLSVFSSSNTGGYALMFAYAFLILSFVYSVYYQKDRLKKSNYLILFSLLFIFVYVLMYVKSVRGRNLFNGFMYSYVMVLFPVFLIILGGIINQINTKIVAVFLIVFLAANGLNYQDWYKLGYHKKYSEPYRAMSTFISTSSYSNAPILCSGSHVCEFYFYKFKKDALLVNYSDLEIKINPAQTGYLWIIDSFDFSSEKMLKKVADKFSVNVKEIKHFKGDTGNIIFRALLLEITNSDKPI